MNNITEKIHRKNSQLYEWPWWRNVFHSNEQFRTYKANSWAAQYNIHVTNEILQKEIVEPSFWLHPADAQHSQDTSVELRAATWSFLSPSKTTWWNPNLIVKWIAWITKTTFVSSWLRPLWDWTTNVENNRSTT